MALELRVRASSYTDPILFVAYGLYGSLAPLNAPILWLSTKTVIDWLLVLINVIITFDYRALGNLSILKDRAFAKFWLAWG